MSLYPFLVVVHIISSVIWLGAFPAQLIIEKSLASAKGKSGERRLASVYLVLINIGGMAGMSGILVTGILLVSILPFYSFFNFSADHWLAAKQVIMVILLVLTFALIIPSGKKLRQLLGADLENNQPLSDEFYPALKKLSKVSLILNLLVLINFLLAITHRFLG